MAGTGNTRAQTELCNLPQGRTGAYRQTALRTSGRPGQGPPLPLSVRAEFVKQGNGSPPNRILGNLLFRHEGTTYRRTLLNKHFFLCKSSNQVIQRNKMSRIAVFLLKQQNQPRMHFFPPLLLPRRRVNSDLLRKKRNRKCSCKRQKRKSGAKQ